MNSDPLEGFFDAPEKLEGQLRSRLAEMLIPFAAGDAGDGTFHPKQSWYNLNTKRKTLVFLLAKLALATKNPELEIAASPKEIEQSTGLPGGTVRPKLSELVKDHIAFKDSDGNYSVRSSPMAINNAWALMESAIPEATHSKNPHGNK